MATLQFWDHLESIIRNNYPFPSESPDTAAVLAYLGSPSTSIAILDRGEISSRCYSTIGSDAETVFQACSISKPVAGMAVMRLVDRGLLDIDAPLHDLLPSSTIELISTPTTSKLVARITLKQLLSHTAGLTVHGFPGYVANAPDPLAIIAGKAPCNTPTVRLAGLPGHRFAYSGGGITLVQLVLQHVTGKTFPDLMKELVLDPLHMHRSFYRRPETSDNYAPAYYTGYQEAEVPFHEQPEMAAAGLWTTPSDLLKVVHALQKALTSEGNSSFITKTLARRMLTEVSDGMALTWLAPKDPGNGFQHGGSDFGYRCYLVGYAALQCNTRETKDADERGLCIMTNSEEGTSVHRKIMLAIAYLKCWPDIAMAYGNLAVLIAFGNPDARPSKTWNEWLGQWDGDWELLDIDGRPHIRFDDLPIMPLSVAARPQFKVQDGVAHDFVIQSLEIMLRLTFRSGEHVIELWHGPKADSKILTRA